MPLLTQSPEPVLLIDQTHNLILLNRAGREWKSGFDGRGFIDSLIARFGLHPSSLVLVEYVPATESFLIAVQPEEASDGPNRISFPKPRPVPKEDLKGLLALLTCGYAGLLAASSCLSAVLDQYPNDIPSHVIHSHYA